MKKTQCFVVFGQLVPIEYEDGLARNEGSAGEYCDKEKFIKIDSELEGDDLSLTQIHEGGHAVCDRIGLSQGISKELEEVIVDSFATFIVENFKLTPR